MGGKSYQATLRGLDLEDGRQHAWAHTHTYIQHTYTAHISAQIQREYRRVHRQMRAELSTGIYTHTRTCTRTHSGLLFEMQGKARHTLRAMYMWHALQRELKVSAKGCFNLKAIRSVTGERGGGMGRRYAVVSSLLEC